MVLSEPTLPTPPILPTLPTPLTLPTLAYSYFTLPLRLSVKTFALFPMTSMVEQKVRIDGTSLEAHFEMQVRCGGPARTARKTNNLTKLSPYRRL